MGAADTAGPVALLHACLAVYASASRQWPLPVAFVTCYVKGAASDIVAQKAAEKKERISWRRNFAFALFSGAYLGCGQHYVYNVIFSRLFGDAQTVKVALQKVVADAIVHVPMVYLPLYYMSENIFLGGSARRGLLKYGEEWWPTCLAYWKIWTFFHFVNFTLTPVEFRIGAIATVSFLWLIVLSKMSHRDLDQSAGAKHVEGGTVAICDTK